MRKPTLHPVGHRLCWLLAALLLSLGLGMMPTTTYAQDPTGTLIDDATQLDPGEVVRMEDGELRQILFSPDEGTLAVATSAGLWIYAPEGQRTGVLLGESPVQKLWWSADSTLLAATLDDGSLELWEVPNRILIGTINGTAGGIVAVAWSPDGGQIATGSDDGVIEIWSIAEAVVLETLEGHTDRIIDLYWIAEGAQLVSSAEDGSVRVWGVEVAAPPTPTPTPLPTPVLVTATVQVDRLNVRSGPGTDFPRIATGLRGESLVVLDQVDECAWIQVQTPDGTEGWVAGGAQFVALSAECAEVGQPAIVPTPTAPSTPAAGLTLPTPTRTTSAPNATPTATPTPPLTTTAASTTIVPAAETEEAATTEAAPADPFPPDQGCYLFQNELPVPLTIIMTPADGTAARTIQLAANQEAPDCFTPGDYTYIIQYQTPEGVAAPEIAGNLTINAGDRFMFPIRAQQ
jgi:dipeptidyl aminopeptidase/acylaminoacyl peptidase